MNTFFFLHCLDFSCFLYFTCYCPSSHCLLLYWCSCLQIPLEFSNYGSWSSNITIKPHSLWECSILSSAQAFWIVVHVSHHAVCRGVMLPPLLIVYAWLVCICSASRIFSDFDCSYYLFCKRQLKGEKPWRALEHEYSKSIQITIQDLDLAIDSLKWCVYFYAFLLWPFFIPHGKI